MLSDQTPDYGNWIRRRAIYILLSLTILFLIGGFVPWHVAIRIVMFCISAVFLCTTLIVAGSYWYFSPKGGKWQQKIFDLVIRNLNWDGKGTYLDIGAGNGFLSIELAKRYPEATGTGLDYWGKNWEYSKRTCETNALLEGVGSRVSYRQGTASKLPFDDSTFDCAVSNLTFHEVRDEKNKPFLIREALRTVKPGGKFSFLDMFYNDSLYGTPEELKTYLDKLGLKEYSLEKVSSVIRLPSLLKMKRVLGYAGVIYGTK